VTRQTRVAVVNLDNDAIIGEIGDLAGVHGVALAPDLGLGFTSNGPIVVIDVRNRREAEVWPISPGESATGMAIDLEHHHLFVGCGNEMMLMMDSRSGEVLSHLPIGKDVGACAFDPVTGLAFASSGVGTVTIAREGDPGTLILVQTLETAPSARTMALDPKTHRIYVAAADLGPRAPGAGPGRPAPIPGSFRVLVFGRD
jgi:DNA-binding beta-propeller fold protein YncE